jgi:hypothetical protein
VNYLEQLVSEGYSLGWWKTEIAVEIGKWKVEMKVEMKVVLVRFNIKPVYTSPFFTLLSQSKI